MINPRRAISIGRLLNMVRILAVGQRHERRRVRQELARLCAGIFGDYYLGEDYKLWRQDQEFIRNFRRLSPHNYYSEERKYALREFVYFTNHLPGDMAECGCYAGVSAYFMASTAPDAALFLFDSFAGLSEPNPEDETESGTRNWRAGDMSVPEALLRGNLSGFANIHVMKGWIPERFPDVAERRFRLVHIDVDLYQPTLDSLQFFYPRLSPGGVIVMDDYGYTTCPGAYRAAREYMADKPEYILHLPTGQGVIVRRPDRA